MPPQRSSIGWIEGGSGKAEPPRLWANHRLFLLHRSAGGGGGPNLITRSKAALLNRTVIHVLISRDSKHQKRKENKPVFKKKAKSLLAKTIKNEATREEGIYGENKLNQQKFEIGFCLFTCVFKLRSGQLEGPAENY